ncbi:MAG: Uncharacterized protein K0R65_1920 [Crocinitomicaceae bacterium]|jgi:energy-coupling factor transporter ATP-binding protein EcfA2|nr:Uncharacterized protein [Crocinitomicaceae bacterium]
MQKKKLRVFAGPNGSGKSTLFNLFKERFSTGFFVNADLIESDLRTKGIFDLNPMNITVSQEDLNTFSQLPEALSLREKSLIEKTPVQFELKEGFIVDKTKNPNSYQAAYIAAFIRFLLAKNRKSFSMELF